MACISKRRGRYVIDFYDQTGKRHWKTLKAGVTQKQAKDSLRDIENLLSKGCYIPDKRTPLFSEVAKDWLSYKEPNVRETTWESYRGYLNNHFSDLDCLKINRITTATIEKYISARQKSGRWIMKYFDHTGKNVKQVLPDETTEEEAQERFSDVVGREKRLLSECKGRRRFRIAAKMEMSKLYYKKIDILTLRKILMTLGQIMSYAVRHRYIEHNPVREAERPRRKVEDQSGGNITVLNPDQIRRLLEATETQKFRVLFMAAIMTGARQGELLGLRWTDVDFHKKQVHIRRTYNHGRFFSPKTKGSIRAIDLSPVLVLKLKKWKLASGAKGDDLVFSSETGTPIKRENLQRRHFEPALKRAGLPNIRFHDLRHSYASLLIEQGENIKYISSQLGHATTTITLDVYSHLLKTENQEAACRLERTIFGGTNG